ncbi:MAG: DUF3313 family protein [Spirochaetaceae bacterium]|nr:DUF3313 family protein [Spirochaetaceae bacterium]
MSRSPFPRLIVSALLLVLATACTSQPAARPVEERFDIATPHGLEEVATRGGHRIFLRPGVRFDDFSRVLIDDFAVSYANARSAADAPPRTLDAETEARLKRTLHDAFAREMRERSSFEVVDSPGPDAIRVQGWIYDLVVEEPPSGDARSFALCFAEMTMVLTVRHSQSAQALARIADRVRLSCEAARGARFHTARWSDVKEALVPWTRFLRRWLDELRELPTR